MLVLFLHSYVRICGGKLLLFEFKFALQILDFQLHAKLALGD
jgi:hypothetical protein